MGSPSVVKKSLLPGTERKVREGLLPAHSTGRLQSYRRAGGKTKVSRAHKGGRGGGVIASWVKGRHLPFRRRRRRRG